MYRNSGRRFVLLYVNKKTFIQYIILSKYPKKECTECMTNLNENFRRAYLYQFLKLTSFSRKVPN